MHLRGRASVQVCKKSHTEGYFEDVGPVKPDCTWSNLQKNRQLKQNPVILVTVVVVLASEG